MSAELEEVVSQELDGLGFDVVEVRRGGTRTHPLIEVRMERKDGAAVTVEDCAKVSRALQERLELGRLVPEQYELQVSSPGERPLRSVQDWRRFIGEWASVSSSAHGRFEAKIVGVEGDSGGEEVLLELLTKGVRSRRRVPVSEINEARLSFHI